MNSYIGSNEKRDSTVRARIRARIRVGLAAGLLILFGGQLQAAPGVLSQNPLFLSATVQSNIFFLLDDSGSMDWEVSLRDDGSDGQQYFDFTVDSTTDRLELCVGYNVLAYDPAKTYTPWYGLDRYGNAFTDIDPTNAPVNPYTGTASGTSNCNSSSRVRNWNGVACNLVSGFGGNGARYYAWTDDGDGEYDAGECSSTATFVSSLSATERTNFANWFSYYRKREYVMKRAVSEIIHDSTERMGLAVINNSSNNVHITNNGYVGTPIRDVDDLTVPINATAAADKAALLDNLLGINSNNGTPLRIGLDRVGRYFMGQDSTTLFAKTITADPNGAVGTSPILDADHGGTCQQNFAIVMSDGFWNGGTNPSLSGDSDGNTDIDEAGDFDGASYSDGQHHTLADAAMYYYENDLVPGLDNDVPIVDIDATPDLEYAPNDAAECTATATLANPESHPNCFDTNTAQHLVTYTVAFGITGTIPLEDGSGNPCVPPSRGSSVASQNWPTSCDGTLSAGWPEPSVPPPSWPAVDDRAVDDMMHAAWNGRGLFLSAKDPQELIDSLKEAISDIESKYPVAAAAVAVDSSSIIGGGNVVQGKFDSTKWKGELYSYAITQTTVGNVTTTTVSSTPTWAAHDLLDARGFSTRAAVTYNGSIGIPFAFPADYTNTANFGVTEISQAQVDDLMYNAPYPVNTSDPTEIAANQAWGQQLVDYLLGDSTHEGNNTGDLRDRDGHKLGDIIHSAPTYVGDPNPNLYYDSSYQVWATQPVPTGAQGRRKMIYVGANDGGLHAFDALTGEEVFVYFPHGVFSNEQRWGLHYLADRSYEHRYYVDGDITVAEVYADLDGVGGNEWSTILVGMLRGGGRSLFAIDISDPDGFTTASSVASKVLWEFTDTELGYTYGKATVAKLNNGKWGVIFGNGYLPDTTASGEASLFIRYLDGTTPERISTGAGSNLSNDCLDAGSDCNGLSAPAVVDLGGDGVADWAYAGDLMGNLWSFDLSGLLSSSWGLAYGASPLFTARDSAAVRQPITSQPAVVLHPTERHSITNPNTLVFFGTGQFIAESDPASTAGNTFYGIWDGGSDISSPRSSALVEQTITQGTLGSEDIRVMTNNPVNYSTHRGWFVDLPDSGERVVNSPVIYGDVVIYNSNVPETNLCSSSGGYSWLMVHNLSDGSEPDYIALDVNNDGVFDSADQTSGGSNVTGKKFGSLTWQITISQTGTGQAIGFIPGGEVDIYSGYTGNFSEEPEVGARSSWGRFKME